MAMKPAMIVASIPTVTPFLTRKGLGISGFLFLKTTNEKETKQYAKQQAKLAASTIQTNITRPKNGAMIEITPKNNIAI